VLVWGLIVLATILMFVSSLTVWSKRRVRPSGRCQRRRWTRCCGTRRSWRQCSVWRRVGEGDRGRRRKAVNSETLSGQRAHPDV